MYFLQQGPGRDATPGTVKRCPDSSTGLESDGMLEGPSACRTCPKTVETPLLVCVHTCDIRGVQRAAVLSGHLQTVVGRVLRLLVGMLRRRVGIQPGTLPSMPSYPQPRTCTVGQCCHDDARHGENMHNSVGYARSHRPCCGVPAQHRRCALVMVFVDDTDVAHRR